MAKEKIMNSQRIDTPFDFQASSTRQIESKSLPTQLVNNQNTQISSIARRSLSLPSILQKKKPFLISIPTTQESKFSFGSKNSILLEGKNLNKNPSQISSRNLKKQNSYDKRNYQRHKSSGQAILDKYLPSNFEAVRHVSFEDYRTPVSPTHRKRLNVKDLRTRKKVTSDSLRKPHHPEIIKKTNSFELNEISERISCPPLKVVRTSSNTLPVDLENIKKEFNTFKVSHSLYSIKDNDLSPPSSSLPSLSRDCDEERYSKIFDCSIDKFISSYDEQSLKEFIEIITQKTDATRYVRLFFQSILKKLKHCDDSNKKYILIQIAKEAVKQIDGCYVFSCPEIFDEIKQYSLDIYVPIEGYKKDYRAVELINLLRAHPEKIRIILFSHSNFVETEHLIETFHKAYKLINEEKEKIIFVEIIQELLNIFPNHFSNIYFKLYALVNEEMKRFNVSTLFVEVSQTLVNKLIKILLKKTSSNDFNFIIFNGEECLSDMFQKLYGVLKKDSERSVFIKFVDQFLPIFFNQFLSSQLYFRIYYLMRREIINTNHVPNNNFLKTCENFCTNLTNIFKISKSQYDSFFSAEEANLVRKLHQIYEIFQEKEEDQILCTSLIERYYFHSQKLLPSKCYFELYALLQEQLNKSPKNSFLPYVLSPLLRKVENFFKSYQISKSYPLNIEIKFLIKMLYQAYKLLEEEEKIGFINIINILLTDNNSLSSNFCSELYEILEEEHKKTINPSLINIYYDLLSNLTANMTYKMDEGIQNPRSSVDNVIDVQTALIISDQAVVDKFSSINKNIKTYQTDIKPLIFQAKFPKSMIIEYAKAIKQFMFSIFIRIPQKELIDSKWVKDPQQTFFTTYYSQCFNAFSFLVISNILESCDSNERLHCYEFYVRLAKTLIKLNDFQSSMAIFAALNNICISKLNVTIPKSIELKKNKITQLFSFYENFSNYRKRLKKCEPGTDYLPYFGLILSDLIHIQEKMQDYLPNGKLNQNKIFQLGEVYESLYSLQLIGKNSPTFPYEYKESISNDINYILQKMKDSSFENDLFDLSCQRGKLKPNSPAKS
jgi:hypothetical protein